MNISNLNNSSTLQNPIEFSGFANKKNKTITGDRFYVGEGILRCDNYFISLDSVCMVELGRRQNSIASSILMIIIGIIICVFSLFLCILNTQIGISGILIGILFVVLGFLGYILFRRENKKIPYSLTIHLNDNSEYSYYTLDKKYIMNIMDVIQSCINDRRGGYNVSMKEEKIERVDNSINIGNIDGFSGNIIGAGGNNIISGNGNNVVNKSNKNNNTALTAEDWMNLEKFFMMRRKEFPTDDRNYKICTNLAACSQRKDAGTMKRYLQTIGKEAVRIIFTASTNVAAMEVVRPIINKILSLKG